MTDQKEVLNDDRYKSVLDKGFVGLVDHMGSDEAIEQAARVSYGAGTRSVNATRGLIRYLMKHRHTSPFEMAVVKFHVKLPIFVMRQLVRHRTASLNEYSARYSVMSDEFYIPNEENLQPQSQTNKQGRDGNISSKHKEQIIEEMVEHNNLSYDFYKKLLDENEEYPGLSRELSRMVLPVSNYTECYIQFNLHNFFHMAKLRMDSHAQWEIQEFARAMYELVKPHFPISCQAFEDYSENGVNFSAQEMSFIKDFFKYWKEQTEISDEDFLEEAKNLGMSQREFDEFKKKFE